MYNLQTKSLKRYHSTQIELSINSKQSFWTSPKYVTSFKDSTHTIYWPTEWMKKSLKQITDQIKKAKKVSENWKETFYRGEYLKSSSINLASVSKHVWKKLWNLLTQLIQFTDLQVKLKKQQTVEKNLSLSILNTSQYKQYLYILTTMFVYLETFKM